MVAKAFLMSREKYNAYGKKYFTEGRGGGMDAQDIFSAFFGGGGGGGRSSYVLACAFC